MNTDMNMTNQIFCTQSLKLKKSFMNSFLDVVSDRHSRNLNPILRRLLCQPHNCWLCGLSFSYYSRELLYDFSQPLNHWSCSDCHSLRDYHAKDINHSARHKICQNFYTTRFWGQKFYTRKGRKLGLFLLTMKQQRCISNLSKFC